MAQRPGQSKRNTAASESASVTGRQGRDLIFYNNNYYLFNSHEAENYKQKDVHV